MPHVSIPGVGVVAFPDDMSPQDIQSAIETDILKQPAAAPAEVRPDTSGVQFPAKVDAGEQSMLDKAGNWLAGQRPFRGSLGGRVMQGMADPGAAAFQMAANALPDSTGIPQAVNKGIAETEQQYQAAKQAYPSSEGFDGARLAGNVALPTLLGAGAVGGPQAGAGALANALRSGAAGGAYGTLQPVTNGGDDFWADKAKQAGIGAAGGAVLGPAFSALGSAVKPAANKAADYLRSLGVETTLGQELGGAWARTEEKLQSVPILGDAIMAARGRARDRFNTAAINETLKPIGESVSGAGHDAVNEATQKIGAAYDAAKASIKGVFVDGQAQSELKNLLSMTQGIAADSAQKFKNIMQAKVQPKVGPNGGMTTEAYKEIDSELGKQIAKYANDPDLNGALSEAQRILKDAARRQNPQFQSAMDAADSAYARLVRVQEAAKASKLTDGVFTPGQLLAGVLRSDRSVRDNATARGEALMQDLGRAGQSVLGNKYPDSGTWGRAALGGLALGGGAMMAPGTTAGLVAGAAAYSPQIQRLATLLARRGILGGAPGSEALALALRRGSPFLGAGVGAAALQPAE